MSFSYNVDGPGNDGGWFRVGTVEVTTTVLVTALAAASIVVMAIYPPLALALALEPGAVFGGQVWRVVTWPLANILGDGQGLWTVLSIFFFWYFGSDLERQVGRSRFTKLVVGYVLALSAVALLVGILTTLPGGLFGINTLQLMVLLTWIAEYPSRRFLFNIPAWAFGAVIVALQVLTALTTRNLFALLSLVLGLVVCALIARSVGLLTDQAWLPNLAGNRAGRPKAPKQRRQRRSRKSDAGPTVVSGPWAQTSSSPQARDQARLDELLDQISERGYDGLSDKEKAELNALRERRSR